MKGWSEQKDSIAISPTYVKVKKREAHAAVHEPPRNLSNY
jgi:hypothetical protein